MMLRAGFENGPHDHLEEIEQQFGTHIDNWRAGAAPCLHSLYAPPGGGKTWLLKRWKSKWQGTYFDLVEHANTTEEYIRRAQGLLAQQTGRHMLYLDNVPVALNEHIQVLQEEILQPALHSGALVIQCQIHPNQTCWGGAIPHPRPTAIPGLTQAGMLAMRQKHGCTQPLNSTEELLFKENGVLPGLVQAWCLGMKNNQKGQTVLRDYLEGWWKRFESEMPNSFSRQIYPYAMLACRNLGDINELVNLLTPDQKQDLTRDGVSFNERGLSLTLKLKRLQWIQADNSWFPPIAAVLKTWLSLRNPALCQALTS